MESIFCGHLGVFSETFPTSGMTCNGVAYALPTWGGYTPDSGYSSSPDGADLLPTPTCQDGKNNGGPSQFSRNTPPLNTRVLMLQTPTAAMAGGVQTLETQVGGRQKYKTLPTPTVSDSNGPGIHGDGGLDLRTAVSLLPTPTTQPETGNGHARNLGKEARLLQTPSVADAMGGHERRGGKRSAELLLNGQAKELSMLPTPRATRGGSSTETTSLLHGVTTSPPSDVGNEPSVGQLPGQLNLLDEMAGNASALDLPNG